MKKSNPWVLRTAYNYANVDPIADTKDIIKIFNNFELPTTYRETWTGNHDIKNDVDSEMSEYFNKDQFDLQDMIKLANLYYQKEYNNQVAYIKENKLTEAPQVTFSLDDLVVQIYEITNVPVLSENLKKDIYEIMKNFNFGETFQKYPDIIEKVSDNFPNSEGDLRDAVVEAWEIINNILLPENFYEHIINKTQFNPVNYNPKDRESVNEMRIFLKEFKMFDDKDIEEMIEEMKVDQNYEELILLNLLSQYLEKNSPFPLNRKKRIYDVIKYDSFYTEDVNVKIASILNTFFKENIFPIEEMCEMIDNPSKYQEKYVNALNSPYDQSVYYHNLIKIQDILMKVKDMELEISQMYPKQITTFQDLKEYINKIEEEYTFKNKLTDKQIDYIYKVQNSLCGAKVFLAINDDYDEFQREIFNKRKIGDPLFAPHVINQVAVEIIKNNCS